MDLEAQWTGAASTAVALITTYGLRVVGAIIILLAGWMASRIVYSAVVRLCQKSPRIDRTVALFLGNGARYTRPRLHLRRRAHHLRHRHHELRGRAGRARHRHRAGAAGHAQQPRRRHHAGAVPALPYRRSHRDRQRRRHGVRDQPVLHRDRRRRQCAHHHPQRQAVGRDRARADAQRHRAHRAHLPAPGQRRHRRRHRPPQGADRAATSGCCGSPTSASTASATATTRWPPISGCPGAMPRRCASTSIARSRKSSSAGRWLQWSAAPDRASIGAWMPPSRCLSRSPTGSPPRSRWAARPCSRSATCMAARRSCACCSTPSPAWPAKQAASGG